MAPLIGRFFCAINMSKNYLPQSFKKGQRPWNKGMKMSEEYRKHLSEVRTKMGIKKDKCYNWKGGSWVFWHAEIRRRDNFTCQICGLYDPDIVEVAHLKPIKGLTNRRTTGHPLNSYENLITLCPNCHRKLDKGIIEI